jgi:PKD repeat protein
VAISSPPAGGSTSGESVVVEGSAGTDEGDLAQVVVQLYSGSTITPGQAPAQIRPVAATRGSWSQTFAGLPQGSYSLRAEQSDDVGNQGVSQIVTFTVGQPAAAAAPVHPASPPVASFSWFPPNPHTHERVSLASSSTDATSPITSLAWDLTGNGGFLAGAQTLSTSFSTPGSHLVRLRVTDAGGLSSVAAATIVVTPRPAIIMQPFPIVRIAGSATRSGVDLRLLSVLAPARARITVSCKGRGCPVKSQSRVAAVGRGGSAPIQFRRFERRLLAGVTLEIRVSRPGEVGKYTSFAIRRGKPPVRLDSCLDPAGVRPMRCPPS